MDRKFYRPNKKLHSYQLVLVDYGVMVFIIILAFGHLPSTPLNNILVLTEQVFESHGISCSV